jgi:hypothetical protein
MPAERSPSHRDPVRAADHRLAIDRERLGAQQDRSRLSKGSGRSAPGEQPNGAALAADLQPVAVVFDLLHPFDPGQRLGSAGRNTGRKETGAGRDYAHTVRISTQNAVVCFLVLRTLLLLNPENGATLYIVVEDFGDLGQAFERPTLLTPTSIRWSAT